MEMMFGFLLVLAVNIEKDDFFRVSGLHEFFGMDEAVERVGKEVFKKKAVRCSRILWMGWSGVGCVWKDVRFEIVDGVLSVSDDKDLEYCGF